MERNLQRFADIAKHSFNESDIKTIVEVGARDCRETLGFRQLFPQATIYAFECNPDTLPQCRRAIEGQHDIHLIDKAVSNQSGTLSFFPIDTEKILNSGHMPNVGASSLFQASGKYQLEKYIQKEIKVETITLESFMQTHSLSTIDLLWMDIQGAELSALQGLGKKIREVKLIHTEVEFMEIYQNQPLFGDVKSYLNAHGFIFLGFTIYARHSADAVFANKRFIPTFKTLRVLFNNTYLVAKHFTYVRHQLKRSLHWQ